MRYRTKMPDWETLKKLTGSTFARHVILVPIIGWLLVYQNTFAQMIANVFGIEVNSALSWEVLVFYVGLVMLGIAASIFRFFGPAAVLNHSGLQGYTEDMEAVLTRKEFKLLCDEIGCEMPEEKRVPAAGTGQVLDETLDQWKRLNCEAIRDVLADHYRTENQTRIGWRRATTITFGIGAALTLVPTIVTIVWVLEQLLAALR